MRRAVYAFIVAFVFALVALVPRAAAAAGALYLAKSGGELPLEKTDVEVDVAGSLVSATVTQRFANTSKDPIEVVYVFPLPQRAAVDAMEMKIGSRTVRASIAKRGDARAAYDAAVREGRRAALLEQERPNVFTFSVGNGDPGAAIDVKLHYFEVAQFDKGTYELVVPTTVGPRFVPGEKLGGPQSGTGTKADTDRVPDASRISPGYVRNGGAKLGIRVHVDAGTELSSVISPTHSLEIASPSPNVADVKLKSDSEALNRDFVFRWKLVADSFKPAFFAHRPNERAPGYLALHFEPKHAVVENDLTPRELFFVIDTSGSMQGTPLKTAIAAMNKAIDAMHPADTFQIIDFADKASTFAPRPLPNTPENREKAHRYLGALVSRGGTNQLAGIHAALSSPGDEARIRYVMFMTDGYIGNEHEVFALTRKEIGNARIFSFGIGSSVNRYLLDEVAIAGRGFAEYLRPHEDGSALVERFYRRIGKPYLTDIEVDWGGLAVMDARPQALPDLSAFSPLVLHARYAKAGEGDVTIKGKIAGRPFAKKLHVVLPAVEPKNEAISRIWARETIAELERVPRGSRENDQAITNLALEHNLMTRFTSFVAIDSAAPPANRTGSPTLVNQPSEAPQGVDIEAAGGVITHGGPSAPAPDHERAELADVTPHRGGCAGCTTARANVSSAWSFLAIAGVAILALRRRR